MTSVTDNRTTELLRRLLDERGVEHYDGTESTLWLKDEHGYRASADELSSGRLSVHIWCDTPEQAIVATLGNMGNSNYAKLFGTPERAARTLSRFCADCLCGDCATCGVPYWANYTRDYDALLEWLRGDAE